ncbi:MULTISPECIES: hypothetical protein [unclassified Bradyrhizobium]|uniref:hypothetical protein n=1 Tax=unclassified Bradyrhizobium TaxID=2631580 RepID=UPI001CD736F8|nr:MULTISPECIES: hypothetical protein [unclassified Bradyrhizobium]
MSRNWLVGFHSDDRMIGGSFQHHRSLEQNTGFVADLDGQGALSAGERHVSRRVGKRNQRSFFGRFEVGRSSPDSSVQMPGVVAIVKKIARHTVMNPAAPATFLHR